MLVVCAPIVVYTLYMRGQNHFNPVHLYIDVTYLQLLTNKSQMI